MIDDNAHIAWKTNAWKDPAMVARYASKMADDGGGNLIKNLVETRLCRRFVAGRSVLDVGVGTGRASRPLAAEGYEVTGVDSSLAMLEKCRELAGAARMTLMQGDVAHLPLGDELFDTQLALNTIAHFPHWETILTEWKRVVKPGGRMIFDVFSLDHDMAVAAAMGKPAAEGRTLFGPKEVSEFYFRLHSEELVAGCDRLGLRIARVVPYGTLFGLAAVNHFLDGTLASGHYFDRLLSWSAHDPLLLECALTIEEQILAHLGSAASGRYMVVLDKVEDPETNRRWLERDRTANAALASGLDAATLEALGADLDALRTALGVCGRHEPALVFCARLLMATLHWSWEVRVEDFFAPAIAARLREDVGRAKLDDDVVRVLETWHQHTEIAPVLDFYGVPLGATIEYESIRPILDELMHVFDRFEASAPHDV